MALLSALFARCLIDEGGVAHIKKNNAKYTVLSGRNALFRGWEWARNGTCSRERLARWAPALQLTWSLSWEPRQWVSRRPHRHLSRTVLPWLSSPRSQGKKPNEHSERGVWHEQPAQPGKEDSSADPDRGSDQEPQAPTESPTQPGQTEQEEPQFLQPPASSTTHEVEYGDTLADISPGRRGSVWSNW